MRTKRWNVKIQVVCGVRGNVVTNGHPMQLLRLKLWISHMNFVVVCVLIIGIADSLAA